MSREKFEELTIKPQGLKILNQKFIVSDEEKFEEEIINAAKSALNNNAIRIVVFRHGPLTDDITKEDVTTYYVTPAYAEKILPPEEVKRIKKGAKK